jgi:hypothetical protein
MTTTFTLTAGQMITRAFRLLGQLTPPWTPTDDQMNEGIIALNLMLKSMQADGINLYRQTQEALVIPAGQGLPATIGTPFQITPPIMGIEDARLVVQPSPNIFERPLAVYSYGDYMNLPNKQQANTTGPSVICIDKQVGVTNIYIWPLASSGCTINATVARTVNDVSVSSDPVDAPPEWMEGLTYSLADRLMEENGVAAADPSTAERITQHAVAFYQKCLNFDRPTSVYVRPWGRKGSGRFWR